MPDASQRAAIQLEQQFSNNAARIGEELPSPRTTGFVDWTSTGKERRPRGKAQKSEERRLLDSHYFPIIEVEELSVAVTY
jgi:hypothetical protein